MEDGSGWFADPDVEGQERYFDGSEWTSETRPADSDRPLLHLPEHVPELQRALAAATADIDDVEARLGRLFDRAADGDGGGGRGGPSRETGPASGASTNGSPEVVAEPEPSPRPAVSASEGVESLLGTEPEPIEDDDALVELDEALAAEAPEKLKRGMFKRH
jgi:hypothetical protein